MPVMPLKYQLHLVFLAQFIIISSLDMSDPYWPLIIQGMGNNLSPTQLQCWSAAIYMVPFFLTIIATPFWGHCGEKIGQKRMLLRAVVALMLTQFLLCLIKQPALVLLVRSLQGIFAGFSAAAQAWSITMSRLESHSYVIGRLQAATAIGTIVGPIIGGFIGNYFGYHAIFFVSSLMLGLIMLFLTTMLQETLCQQQTVDRLISNNWYGIDKGLFYLLLIICFAQVARWMSSSFFALYVLQRLNGNNLMVGGLYSSIALIMFLSAPQWGAMLDKKIHHYDWVKWILVSLLFLAGFSQCLFAFLTNIYFILFACLLWGICLSAISLIPFALLVRYTKEPYKSQMIGFGNSASKLGNLMGVGLGAFVQIKMGYTYSFLAISLVYFGLAVLAPLLQQQFKSLELETC